jgi:hypothetical protein
VPHVSPLLRDAGGSKCRKPTTLLHLETRVPRPSFAWAGVFLFGLLLGRGNMTRLFRLRRVRVPGAGAPRLVVFETWEDPSVGNELLCCVSGLGRKAVSRFSQVNYRPINRGFQTGRHREKQSGIASSTGSRSSPSPIDSSPAASSPRKTFHASRYFSNRAALHPSSG